MKFLRRFLAKRRASSARKLVARDPSPRTYAALAQEYVRMELLPEALEVCEEGLAAFAGNTLLSRLMDRTRRAEREERMSRLRQELTEAPRPALWSEMCEILLDLGRIGRAEDSAQQWLALHEGDEEARLMLARVRVERFYADRGRDQGLAAISAIEEACRLIPEDTRPLKLRLALFMRIGAWRDARETARALLELVPGSPEIESRYRTLEAQAASAVTVDKALLDVQRTGHFVDEDGVHPQASGDASRANTNVRPTLKKLADDADVHAALYVKGSTVLIHGPKGATAERMARGVREILTSARTTSRRLGLGQIFQVQIEGDFGKLSVAPGDADAGAVWSRGALGRSREELLLGLAGLNAEVGSEESMEVGS